MTTTTTAQSTSRTPAYRVVAIKKGHSLRQQMDRKVLGYDTLEAAMSAAQRLDRRGYDWRVQRCRYDA